MALPLWSAGAPESGSAAAVGPPVWRRGHTSPERRSSGALEYGVAAGIDGPNQRRFDSARNHNHWPPQSKWGNKR